MNEKLLQKFLNNPIGVRYGDLARILEAHGFFMVEAKGSHKKWKHAELTEDLIIPVHNNDCLEVYKKKAKRSILSLKK